MRRCCWLLWFCLGGCAEAPELVIGWTPEEPAAEISKKLAQVYEQHLPLRTSRFATNAELLARLSDGTIDIAIVEGRSAPLPGVRAVRYLYPGVLHVLTRSCPASGTLRQLLADRSVYPGPEGSAGHRLLGELTRAGLLPERDAMQVLTTPFGTDVDVLMAFGGILTADAVRRLSEYCLATLDDPEQLGQGSWVEGIAYRFPSLRPMLIPEGVYPTLQNEPVLTLSVPAVLAVHKDVPEDTVYRLAELTSHHGAELRRSYPLAASDEQVRHLRDTSFLPIHPGAQRFIDRHAPTILERFAEPLALGLTLLIALSSAVIALLRYRQQQRKDRLDRFFHELLEVRTRLGATEPQAARSRILDLQATVTDLVTQERLTADASLVAFFVLSNQVLAEASGSMGGDGTS